MALAWDFARQLSSEAVGGNTVSYSDETCQSIYIQNGSIRTQIAHLIEGQWQSIDREEELDISDSGFSCLDIEHHFNGIVFGSAQHDSDVVFLMYEYLLDVSNWLINGAIQLQPDNTIKAGSIALANADQHRFEDSAYTLFSPGNRLRFLFRSGDSEPCALGFFYIESSPFADIADSFTFRGRNAIGFHLATQTFDERTGYSGTRTEVFTQLLLDSGVPANLIVVQADENAISLSFGNSQKYLEGLTNATDRIDWYFDDLPDGRIVVGDEDFIKSIVATTGIYTFNRGSEVISRQVDRDVNGVYSRVCVRRGGASPLSLYADVPFFDGWYVAQHRTHYEDVSDDTGQEDMERIRDQLVDGLQYCGITEKFDSPFRPWLQVGDVAVVTGGNTARIVGIITDIQHQFGRNGFFTQFTVTSGGKISNPDNPATVATRYAGKLGGANRKRRLLDYIHIEQSRK